MQHNSVYHELSGCPTQTISHAKNPQIIRAYRKAFWGWPNLPNNQQIVICFWAFYSNHLFAFAFLGSSFSLCIRFLHLGFFCAKWDLLEEDDQNRDARNRLWGNQGWSCHFSYIKLLPLTLTTVTFVFRYAAKPEMSNCPIYFMINITHTMVLVEFQFSLFINLSLLLLGVRPFVGCTHTVRLTD